MRKFLALLVMTVPALDADAQQAKTLMGCWQIEYYSNCQQKRGDNEVAMFVVEILRFGEEYCGVVRKDPYHCYEGRFSSVTSAMRDAKSSCSNNPSQPIALWGLKRNKNDNDAGEIGLFDPRDPQDIKGNHPLLSWSWRLSDDGDKLRFMIDQNSDYGRSFRRVRCE